MVVSGEPQQVCKSTGQGPVGLQCSHFVFSMLCIHALYVYEGSHKHF